MFDFLQRHGNIESSEMRRTFNCGVGMVAVVGSDEADRAVALLEEHGESAWRIGRIVPGKRSVAYV